MNSGIPCKTTSLQTSDFVQTQNEANNTNILKKISSDNLKSMLCIHSDISNKPASIVDNMSTSTSHASDSEIDFIDIKPVIVDTACLENSCLTNHVMPKSKDTGTQAHGKFVPICHNCGKIGHIRPNW
jgi:SepF-like predicted cell division protein (DUF552 family)